jgi:hypothetical protein
MADDSSTRAISRLLVITLETLYGFPIGLGFGLSLSSAYLGLIADLEPFQAAVGTSGLYMCPNLGSLVGVRAALMPITVFVERELRRGLRGLRLGLEDVEK